MKAIATNIQQTAWRMIELEVAIVSVPLVKEAGESRTNQQQEFNSDHPAENAKKIPGCIIVSCKPGKQEADSQRAG